MRLPIYLKTNSLTGEQKICLLNILTKGTQKSVRRKVEKVLTENLYTLMETFPFFQRFSVRGDSLSYYPEESIKFNAETKAMRHSILAWADNNAK